MANSAREGRVIKNVSAQMVAAVIQGVLGFVSRKVFLAYLGENLLGLNGVMTSIIGMLSLAELGVGEAISYSLYEPLAKGDKEQVASIMALYRRLYLAIGVTIVVLGAALTPFLRYVIKVSVPVSTIYIAFGAYLLDTFLSYCLGYSRSIITADQKDYIVIRITMMAQTVLFVTQIALVLTTKSYFSYLLSKAIVAVIQNVYINVKAHRMYPFLKKGKKKRLSNECIGKLVNNVKALFVTKVSWFLVGGTDNLLLSSFVSLAAVAVYNNYVTIISLINSAFNVIFGKATAVIGNYIVVNGAENAYPLFKRIFFINFLITSYTSIGIALICNEVISVWLGEEFIWPVGLVALLMFNNYSRYILQTCESFRGAAGLYCPKPFVKYCSLAEGIINLLLSLALIFTFENRVIGIFMGTAISTLVSTIAVPWIVYRFLFMRPLKDFFGLYLRYLGIGILAYCMCGFACAMLFTQSHLLNVIIGIPVCTVVCGCVYIVFFFHTNEFRYCLNLAGNFVKQRKK